MVVIAIYKVDFFMILILLSGHKNVLKIESPSNFSLEKFGNTSPITL